jgi:hypothetical protein
MIDLGVNRPFKNIITNEFTLWMITTGSNKPRRQDVSRWISTSWNNISVDNIMNSWRNVGFRCEEDFGVEEGENNSYNLENDDDALM